MTHRMTHSIAQEMHASTVKALRNCLQQHSDVQRLVVAYSGGLDSMVLLHALVALRNAELESRPILAVHVNHQLSPKANQWQQHCEGICQEWDVPLQTSRVVVSASGKGLEAAARDQRYQVFSGVLQAGDGLLLAHHQNDQAETLLLRLMRGAGPKGLASMEPAREFGAGTLLRPLLSVARNDLEAWADKFELTWVEDESNQTRDFDRNYLRHEIMPLLEQRWPKFAERWQQTADTCRATDAEIQAIAEQDLAQSDLRSERWGWSIDLQPMVAWDSFRRGNLLRCVLHNLNLSGPEQAHLQQIEQQIFFAYDDARSDVRWGDVSIRRFRQRLYLLPLAQALSAPPHGLQWDGQQPLRWKGGELIRWPVASGGMHWPTGMTLNVGVRQGGERCQPAGKDHSQKLKKLLLEYELEAWLRDLVPVLSYQDEIVAVADLWVCEAFTASDNQQGYRLEWQRSAD